MGEKTGITWCHHTMNPWIGCAKVSPACDHCYAEAGSRRLGAQHGLKLWDGDRYFTGADYWKQPIRWNRAAEKAGERRRVFCASYADVFEDRDDLRPIRNRLGLLIDDTPWLDWLLLTKRPENIVRMWPDHWSRLGTVPRNVWLGTTCEDSQRAAERIPHLLAAPRVPVKFVSYEPALGPIDFVDIIGRAALDLDMMGEPSINWIIVGGESGAHARPFDIAWARSAVAQCRAADVACFVKQLGHRAIGEPPVGWTDDLGVRHYSVNRWILDGGSEWVPPLIGERNGLRPDNAIGWVPFDSHGGDWSEWPEDLRVRQWPRADGSR